MSAQTNDMLRGNITGGDIDDGYQGRVLPPQLYIDLLICSKAVLMIAITSVLMKLHRIFASYLFQQLLQLRF